MTYTIKMELPESYTSMTMTPELEALVEKEAPVRRKMGLKGRIAAYALAALIPLMGVVGCGPDNPNPGDPVPPIAGSYNPADSFSPADGTVYGVGDSVINWSFDAPVASVDCLADADCAGIIAGGIESVDLVATADNATPGNGSDDETRQVFEDSGVAYDSAVSGSIPLDSFHGGAGLSDGERVTLEATIVALDAEGNEQTVRGSVEILYEAGSVNPVRVTGCYVRTASVGLSINIGCECESDNGSITGWNLTGGPDGATIFTNGNILTPDIMEASDVGLHAYNVTCTDGSDTSDVYTFTVPVDEHAASILLYCQGAGDESLKLPETSVDAVATACGFGAFNAGLKPSTGADPEYILELDETCVQDVIASLPAQERDSHENYNNGTTVDDVYSSCTVDGAQVRYISNN